MTAVPAITIRRARNARRLTVAQLNFRRAASRSRTVWSENLLRRGAPIDDCCVRVAGQAR
jgi:hypothetical protein